MIKRSIYIAQKFLRFDERKSSLYANGIFSYLKNSRGYVLVLVLIMTTLLVTVTGEFLSVSQVNIGYAKKFDEKLKAGLISSSGIDIAKFILKAEKSGLSAQMLTGKTSDPNVSSYNSLWALNLPELPLGDGLLKLEISDENSKINLSILANEFVNPTPYYSIAQRFFINMGLPMDFADIILDWVDPDDSRYPYGAEFPDFYSALPAPYRPKNFTLDSIDEVLMVKNMTPEIFYGLGGGSAGLEQNLVDHNKGNINLDFDKLSAMIEKSKKGTSYEKTLEVQKPEEKKADIKIGKEKSRRLDEYLRAYGNRDDYLDEKNKININTAPFRVISALTDNMTDDRVMDLIRRRLEAPFKSTSEIKDIIEDENIRKNILTVKSYIFKIVSTGTFGDTKVKTTVYYDRDANKIFYSSTE